MKINILVIEDHEADTELIKYYLNEAGFKHNFFSLAGLVNYCDGLDRRYGTVKVILPHYGQICLFVPRIIISPC